jgi:hypothetical protein
MAEIREFLFPVLSFLTAIVIMLQPLISFADQSHNSSLVSLVVRTSLFFFLHLTFVSAIVLLALHVAIPQSVYTTYLTMVTRALTLATLLLGALLMVNFIVTSAIVPDTIKATVIVAALLITYLLLVRSSFNLLRYLATGFGPTFLLLCISTGTLSALSVPYHHNSSSLCNILIHLFLFCNFILAMVLLFLRASAAPDGT